MKIHRYKLRPGVTEIPEQLPQGRVILDSQGRVSLDIEERVKGRSINNVSENFDLDCFIILDEQEELPFAPFYNWMRGEQEIGDVYEANIIANYNEAMDNITWIIRDYDKESEVSIETTNATLYTLNQQAYAEIAAYNDEQLAKGEQTILSFLEDNGEENYYMLLCRELYDYTVFRKKTLYPYQYSIKQLIKTLKTRGLILDIHYNKDNNYLELWVRYRQDQTPHMYIFFGANSFVVNF